MAHSRNSHTVKIPRDFLELACVVSVGTIMVSKVVGLHFTVKFNALRSGFLLIPNGCQVQKEMKTLKNMGHGSATKPNIKSGSASEKVAKEFIVNVVTGKRDVNHDERLEVVFAWYLKIVKEDGQEEDEPEKLNSVESCRQQDPKASEIDECHRGHVVSPPESQQRPSDSKAEKQSTLLQLPEI
ncbi:hypothetical protein POTOM_004191 [Populus tomentosa]|uniref:Uncharacterized protein n=1 Tax=Populus tomentosa TaxID=118781 RepID=A0A8X8DDI2_POPTO|nr:hypothetical protein POTOM_004191 [Populus tomentosa]